ncbi:MAG: hypothetical protein AAGF99_00320 [Bacteroidota bacterium]
MNAAIQDRWLAALRGGGYSQTQGQLRDDHGFCCLGVLSDVVADDVGGKWDDDDFCVGPEKSSYALVPSVQEHCKIGTLDPKLPTKANPFLIAFYGDYTEDDTAYDTLADYVRDNTESKNPVPLSILNDHGVTFAEIADLIETFGFAEPDA